MGLAVYITMDIYLFGIIENFELFGISITGPFFVIFIGVWIYLRHYINLQILWSVLTEFRTVGDFELNWITQQYKCWISQPITFS